MFVIRNEFREVGGGARNGGHVGRNKGSIVSVMASFKKCEHIYYLVIGREWTFREEKKDHLEVQPFR